MIKVSVIIPIYNMERYLKECLDSVLAQTLKEIEIICIDDGSTDYSHEILLAYRERYANIFLVRQENQGAGPAKNRGMACAKGKYICFMDPDDYYAQDQALELLYKNAEENGVSVCGGDFITFYENGNTKRPKRWFSDNQIVSFKDYGNYDYFTSYIIRRSFIMDNHILFPAYRRYEDPPFLLQVMAYAESFYAVNEPVYAYRVGHKEEHFTLETILDILNGIYDCFKIAEQNNLVKVYEEHLKYKMIDYLEIIYPYIGEGQKKVWDIIHKINDISLRWRGEILEMFRSQESLKEYIEETRTGRDHMVEACLNAEEVVIYGAGEAGRFFLDNYGNICRHIAGFAVSKRIGDSFVGGYPVRMIQEYERTALVVIAVSRRYMDEMRRNLGKLQFINVCCAEYNGLSVLKKIENRL